MKHRISDDLFLYDKPICEIESYLLGLLYADGTVVANGNPKTYKTMKIKLQKNDELYLLEVNKYLNGNITYSDAYLNKKLYPQISLSVYNINFVNRIIKLGIVPNKTYDKSSFCFENIPYNLKWHFIRGFFDGDGCISTINKRKDYMVELGSHNENFINSIHLFIKTEIQSNSNVTIGDGVFRIRYGGAKQIINIRSKMYENATIFMDRKYRIFLKVETKQKVKSKYKYITYIPNNKNYPWVIRIKDKRCGKFKTEKDALIYFNNIANNFNLKIQNWEGETL